MKFKTKPKVKITKDTKSDGNVNYTIFRLNKHRNTEIGNLEIDMSAKEKYFVVSAHLNETYRGNGFGKKLYEHALKDLGKLKTRYFDASEEAQWVWYKLDRKFKSRKNFFKGTLTLYNELKYKK